MDYFNKVKNASIKVAAQGMSLIQNVSHDMGLSATSAAHLGPTGDFNQRFHLICQIFDNLAKVESDVEAERILQESKVHEHMKAVLKYLHDEDKEWYNNSLVQSGDRQGDESVDASGNNAHPCFDVLLRNRFMEELCSRARQDRPRGCLLLVLVMVTSILRNVRYPLLPHQSVHKPIYQLISDSSSISSVYNSISKSKQPTSREFSVYVKKVDAQLVKLISALWAKIADNPPLLIFFMFVDKRNGMKRSLDAISCLIPLMGKPKIGSVAKEALLTSIGMHHPSVDSFILDETNLKVNIIAELSKKFQNCVAALMLNVSSESISSGTHRLTQNDELTTTAEKSVTTSTDSFIKVLHFCAAVVATASPVSDTASSSIRSVMLKLFADVFLLAVKTSLLENGEEQVLAAQSVLRRIFQETFESPGEKKPVPATPVDASSSERLVSGFSKSTSPLCSAVTAFVCDDEIILQTLVRRVGSVSRPVSVSTIQLLSSLLEVSSLAEASRLVVDRGRQEPGATNSAETIDILSEINASVEAFLAKYMSSCDDLGLGLYVQASINHILGKLAGSGEQTKIILCSENNDDGDFGLLFMVSHLKLQNFLSLKYDEQLCVTGLINKCIVGLLSCLLSSPSSALNSRVFYMLSMTFDTVRGLEEELRAHKGNIPESDVKYDFVRQVLAAPSTSDPQIKKVVESEHHQVVRILESCIMIEELSSEMEGSVLAFQQLLFLSSSVSSAGSVQGPDAPEFSMSSSVLSPAEWPEDSWSTDDESGDICECDDSDQKDHGTELENDSSVMMQSLNITMDNFLEECESMESQLEEALQSSQAPSSGDPL